MPANSRRQLNGKFLVLLAVLAAALLCNSADAQRLRIIPVPPHVVPQWTPMPDLPQVAYAPNLPTDVFKHRGRYYLYWAGVWYRSKKIKGPWIGVQRPPAVLSQINQEYFKTRSRPGPQQPETATLGPPRDDVFLTPDGKPAVPPAAPPARPRAPVPPAPPAEAHVPPTSPPTSLESAPPLLPSEEKQPQSPLKPLLPPAPEKMAPPVKGAQPVEPDVPGEDLEDQEPAPLAVPKGDVPKMM